ncbi:2-C-methyl-D-erythritol 2,4-cyclodiphosphate synthase [Chlamydiales bacterium SCGC AG-110-M15]|nr:2-C-methyl-D-erythritol 2,4-cyclodiphosphate synthase [Chlamydiales bacterium SCGC AG-110-M15]
MSKFRSAIGQDSHRFLPAGSSKPCVIGGLVFDDCPGFSANSDGDVIYHALCNAITSLTGVLVMGGIADEMCLKDGITDSQAYLAKALATLGKQKITHVSITLEAKKPKIKDRREELCAHIASVMGLDPKDVGITATTGEGLTDFGCGDGVQAFCIISTMEE